jgi:hypothetical protein
MVRLHVHHLRQDIMGEVESGLPQGFHLDDPETSDQPTAERVVVNVEDAIRKALANRTDIVVARKQLENSEYDIAYTQNQRLPGLDLIAAYGTSGLGGTLLERNPAQGPFGPVIGTEPGGYGDALSAAFSPYPTWTVGLNFSYPILNRQAGAAHARAQAAPLVAALPPTRLVDLVGRTDLLTAAAVLKRAVLFIGNDTGVMHMAAAVGTPTLGLFGPSLAEHYAPWGPRTAVVRTTKSYAEIIGAPDYDYRTTDTQMDSLSVDAAEAAARRLWATVAGEAA